MTSRPAAAQSRKDGDLSVTVIITNWNYGHFLAGCIECVLGQTRRPDEIIVVDDGSTDSSPEILEAFRGRVDVIRKANGGQASAFNAGFARSSGEIVMFLDADDLLRPDAVETVVTWWRPDLSYLSFWLDLIDTAGRSRGIYEESLRTDEGDKRRRLIQRGVFAFTPTSGNAFSRAFLQGFLPLDEARWRISADLPLIYAAALHGPLAIIPRVLGAYRTHGSNNYYRERVPDAWRLHRGMRDVMDALALLAERAQANAGQGPDGPFLALALRLASLRMRVKLQTLEGNTGDLPAYARRHLGRLLSSHLAIKHRAVAAVPFLLMACGGWRSSALRLWTADARTRPALVEEFIRVRREHRPHGLFARLRSLERLRWHAPAPPERFSAPDFNGPVASIMAEGWSGEMSDHLHWSRGPDVTLEFAVDPTPRVVRLDIHLVMEPTLKKALVEVETMIGARRLTLDHLVGSGLIGVDLPREMLDPAGVIRLHIRCVVLRDRRPRWRRGLEPPTLFAIRACRIAPIVEPPAFPLLVPASRYALDQLLPSGVEKSDWHLDANGVAWMVQAEATLHVTVAPTPNPLAICVTLPAAEARGWLRLTCGDLELFSGTITSGAELQCRLPSDHNAEETGFSLVFSFTANDPTDPARFGVASIGIATLLDVTGVPPATTSARSPRLNIGERVDLDLATDRGFTVGTGWHLDETTGLSTLETEASFTLNVAPDGSDFVVHLTLEPLLPAPEGHHHVVAVSSEHELLVSARLQGPGDLAVVLPPHVIGGAGDVEMTLHSVFVIDGSDPESSAPPMVAGVKLRAVTLSGQPARRSVEHPPAPTGYSGSALSALSGEVAGAIDRTRPQNLQDLRDLRGRLITALMGADRRGLESHLGDPAFLERIEILGAMTAGMPFKAVRRANSPNSHDDVLRDTLCAMLVQNRSEPARLKEGEPLNGPAGATVGRPEQDGGQGFALPEVGEIPTPLLWSTRPVARQLARGARDVNDGPGVERLLESVLDALRRHPRRSARYRLAVEILEELGPGIDTDFGAIQTLWARCVELHLSRAGCSLGAGPTARSTRSRLRVGFLLRSTSPSWEAGTASAIGSALDRTEFEPVLITIGPSHAEEGVSRYFETVVDLLDAPVGECAGAIRRVDLDILLVPASLWRLDKLTALAAHRLARAQRLLSGDAGFGNQLRSVTPNRDSTAAADSAGRVRSPAHLLAPLPCLDVFATTPAETPIASAARRNVELPRTAPVVLLASAAGLAEHPSLCAMWIRILARAPTAELFVATGSKPGDDRLAPAMVRGLVGLWCREMGVAQERVTLVDASTSSCLGSVDLYLADLVQDPDSILDAARVGAAFAVSISVMSGPREPETWAACLFEAGLVDRSAEACLETAVRLIDDEAVRAGRRAAASRALGAAPSTVPAEIARGLNQALQRMAADAGLHSSPALIP